LEILQVLWQRGASTVREVQDLLKESRGTGYTTTLKQLQIMHRKGLVARNEGARSHVYSAEIEAEETQRRMVGKFLRRVFEGSSGRLVMQALAEEAPSPEELVEIRRFLNRMESVEKE
jgi:predicted transcriptional regulator